MSGNVFLVISEGMALYMCMRMYLYVFRLCPYLWEEMACGKNIFP